MEPNRNQNYRGKPTIRHSRTNLLDERQGEEENQKKKKIPRTRTNMHPASLFASFLDDTTKHGKVGVLPEGIESREAALWGCIHADKDLSVAGLVDEDCLHLPYFDLTPSLLRWTLCRSM